MAAMSAKIMAIETAWQQYGGGGAGDNGGGALKILK
jgi:hypothetical protein